MIWGLVDVDFCLMVDCFGCIVILCVGLVVVVGVCFVDLSELLSWCVG